MFGAKQRRWLGRVDGLTREWPHKQRKTELISTAPNSRISVLCRAAKDAKRVQSRWAMPCYAMPCYKWEQLTAAKISKGSLPRTHAADQFPQTPWKPGALQDIPGTIERLLWIQWYAHIQLMTPVSAIHAKWSWMCCIDSRCFLSIFHVQLGCKTTKSKSGKANHRL